MSLEQEQSQPIPTENGWPLLGILPKFLSGDPFEYLKSIMLERGDFVKLHFGPQSIYLVSHPDYLQRILRDNYENYSKPAIFYDTVREVAKNGLGTSSGEFWLRQRRMIQPHLHRKQLATLFSDMKEAITEELNAWEPLAKNAVEVDLGDQMANFTMNIITRAMFGKVTIPSAEIKEMSIRISQILDYIGETLYSTMLPKWFPIPGKRQFNENRRAVKETVSKIVAKCRAEKDVSASLIQMLINDVDEESHEQMTEQQLFDEVMSIFVGGYETTATALTWLGVVIHKHPDIMEKLLIEIDQTLGGRTPSYEDIPRLTYTRQVFMEILRMYTIAPFLPRALNQDDQLGKYHLPANALVFVFFHGVHHNPHIWEDPEVFNPERFSPENMAGRNPFAYVPFSAGPRKCAGDEFAMLEGPLIMAMMFQKYNINVLPNQKFVPRLGGTMRPGNGVKAEFSLRTAS
jgi:cytochrome P450